MAAKLARYSWLPGGLAAAVLIVLGRLLTSPSFAPGEIALYDRVMRSESDRPSSQVVIVTIDQASRNRIGQWPWPADVHANFLDQLSSAGARVVGFTTAPDVSRSSSEAERLRAALSLLESSSLGRSQQAAQLRRLIGETSNDDPHAHLASAMRAHGNVVLPIGVRAGESGAAPDSLPAKLWPRADVETLRTARPATVTSTPSATLAGAASAVGHTLLAPDGDGVLRTDIAGMRVADVLVPSLAVAIASRAFASGTDSDQPAFSSANELNLGARTTTLGYDLTVRPQYFRTDGTANFIQYSYWQILSGDVPAEELRDKIVLVGATDAPESNVLTPMGIETPPLLATASAVSSLIGATEYVRPGFATVLEWTVTALVVAFAAFMVPAAGLALGALAAVVLTLIVIVSELAFLSAGHLWIRLLLPAGGPLAGYGVYLIGELIRRANNRESKRTLAHLRSLGQTFQRQGQLDLAFETYRRCPLDPATMELLYYLGMDFEKRAQLQKASNVYAYIATRDPNYRDLRARRARVKEEPLTRSPATRNVGSSNPPPDARRAMIEDSEPPIPNVAARTLGRYEIERELGKGAMGTVYLGRDPKINRVVAIKAIPLAEEFAEDDLAEARARFFREAEMAGRLNHPAIVTVYDAGEDQGLAYIAMEYLRGQHLSHFTDPARLLPYKTVMLLGARVADALHYAHRQNVVHRDIKPANIMFDPDADELKITDFGIARLTDTSRTKTGIVLGTPSFMSPEQLEGRTLDGRSDQFALGISLYQLLSGQLPFRADSMPRLMQKIATEPHASIRLIRPELPPCVDAILNRVLAKSADDRYATCAEVGAALRACAGPVEAPRSAEPKHEWLLP